MPTPTASAADRWSGHAKGTPGYRRIQAALFAAGIACFAQLYSPQGVLPLLAADLVLIPVSPSPLDGWASAEMLALLREARVYRPELVARFVLNRCGARTVLARETAETLADHDPPVLATTIGQRIAFASAAQTGRLVCELDDATTAAREAKSSSMWPAS